MFKYFFTVFTPTYNRAYKLRDLYESLKRQTFKNFEWLIVDDGSEDNTKELIREFEEEKIIAIRYIKKNNQGKHIAINVGAEEAQGKWFFIVDSDDWLVDDALEISKKYCCEIENDEKFAGVVGLRGNSDKKIWSTSSLKNIKNKNTGCEKVLDKEYVDVTPIEYRYKLKIAGDRAEIVRTDLLKQYKFPYFDGENFMPESFLWHSLSIDGYKFRWFNKVIYITEYLEDGLTQNGKEHAKKSCLSRSFVDNISVGIKDIPIRIRFKRCINYYRYGMYGGNKLSCLFKKTTSKLLSIFAIPIALIMRIK